MTRWIHGGVLLVAAAVLPAARPVFLVALMVLPGFALERLIRGRRSSSPDWLAVLLLAVGGAYTVSLVLNALAAATGAHLEHRDIDPMAELVRVHRLCVLRSGDLGLDPDHPRSLSRSVILDE